MKGLSIFENPWHKGASIFESNWRQASKGALLGGSNWHQGLVAQQGLGYDWHSLAHSPDEYFKRALPIAYDLNEVVNKASSNTPVDRATDSYSARVETDADNVLGGPEKAFSRYHYAMPEARYGHNYNDDDSDHYMDDLDDEDTIDSRSSAGTADESSKANDDEADNSANDDSDYRYMDDLDDEDNTAADGHNYSTTREEYNHRAHESNNHLLTMSETLWQWIVGRISDSIRQMSEAASSMKYDPIPGLVWKEIISGQSVNKSIDMYHAEITSDLWQR